MQATDYSNALKNWMSQLRTESDISTRVKAAESLGYHNTAESLAALSEALTTDVSERVRQTAASSLWKLSPEIDPARDALFESLKDPFPGVRVRSSWALQNAGVKPEKLAVARRTALNDPKSTVSTKFWAAYGLVGIDDPIQLIDHVLTYARSTVRSKPAENALKKLVSQKDRRIIAPMRAMVTTHHKGNAIVLKGLQQFTPRPEKLVELLCLQFNFNDIELDREIIALLRNQGKKEKDVKMWLPFVKPYLLGKDRTALLFSLDAVTRAEGLAADAVPELVMLMEKATDKRIRQMAAQAVGTIGDRNNPYSEQVKTAVANQTVPLLKAMMHKEKNALNRLAAVRALNKLKTDPGQVIPAFLAVAEKDPDVSVRICALSAIGARGADSTSVIADLENLAGDDSRQVRQAAADALTMIKRKSNRTAETLVPEDRRDNKIRKTAMAALRSADARFDENGFMRALNQNKVDAVKAYLDSGISPNYRFRGTHDSPALNEVFTRATTYLMQGRKTPQKLKDTVRLLIGRGADPDLTDKMGNTALMIAAMACDGETLKILLDAGADLDLKNNAGLTALEFTFMLANPGADILLQAGARLPRDKVDGYLQAYGKNPEAAALIRRAAR